MEIVRLYASGDYLPSHIAKTFNITSRRVRQIANKHGVFRSHVEANELAQPLKRKQRIRRAKTHYNLP